MDELINYLRKFYGANGKTQFMGRDVQTSETVIVLLERGQRHLGEILECFIVSSVAKDCLVSSQYDLHHGSFLLDTPIVMSSYKSTNTHCKSTFLLWGALLSKLGSK